jgi:hypothetical protein
MFGGEKDGRCLDIRAVERLVVAFQLFVDSIIDTRDASSG